MDPASNCGRQRQNCCLPVVVGRSARSSVGNFGFRVQLRSPGQAPGAWRGRVRWQKPWLVGGCQPASRGLQGRVAGGPAVVWYACSDPGRPARGSSHFRRYASPAGAAGSRSWLQARMGLLPGTRPRSCPLELGGGHSVEGDHHAVSRRANARHQPPRAGPGRGLAPVPRWASAHGPVQAAAGWAEVRSLDPDGPDRWLAWATSVYGCSRSAGECAAPCQVCEGPNLSSCSSSNGRCWTKQRGHDLLLPARRAPKSLPPFVRALAAPLRVFLSTPRRHRASAAGRPAAARRSVAATPALLEVSAGVRQGSGGRKPLLLLDLFWIAAIEHGPRSGGRQRRWPAALAVSAPACGRHGPVLVWGEPNAGS